MSSSYEDDPFENDVHMESITKNSYRSSSVRQPSTSSGNKYHVGLGSIVTPLQVSKSQSTIIPTKTSLPDVRIKIMSATRDTNYLETVETPAHSSLRSLRVFILKTFPYFPTKFLFRVHKDGKSKRNLLTISQEQEKKNLVSMLPHQEVFVQRHIAKHAGRESAAPESMKTDTVVPIKRAKTAGPSSRSEQVCMYTYIHTYIHAY